MSVMKELWRLFTRRRNWREIWVLCMINIFPYKASIVGGFCLLVVLLWQTIHEILRNNRENKIGATCTVMDWLHDENVKMNAMNTNFHWAIVRRQPNNRGPETPDKMTNGLLLSSRKISDMIHGQLSLQVVEKNVSYWDSRAYRHWLFVIIAFLQFVK